MSPLEYCQKWVPVLRGINPGQSGWKTVCIHELKWVTGLNESTIKGWGAQFQRYPDYVGRWLALRDTVNQTYKNLEVIVIEDD